jgi:hypothetical protein
VRHRFLTADAFTDRVFGGVLVAGGTMEVPD